MKDTGMQGAKPYSILGAAVFAAVFLGLNVFVSTGESLPSPVTDDSVLYGIAILALPAMAFGYWFPRSKVGYFGRAWKLPANTMLFARWIVQLVGSIQIGLLIGLCVLSIMLDTRYAVAVLLLMPSVACFLWSASIRFRKQEGSEFVHSFSLWRMFRS